MIKDMTVYTSYKMDQMISLTISNIERLMNTKHHKTPPGFSPHSSGLNTVYLTTTTIPDNIYIDRPFLICVFDNIPYTELFSFGTRLFSFRYSFISISHTQSTQIWIGVPEEHMPTIQPLFYHFTSAFPFLNQTIARQVSDTPKNLTVKLMCNWICGEELCKCWNKMSQGNLKWNNLTFVSDTLTADYYVIINKPPSHVYYDPKKTIVFRMEPDTGTTPYWNDWFLHKSEFMFFLDLETHRNNSEWHLGKTMSELKTNHVVKTHNRLSSVMSSLYNMEGHKLRIDFLKYIEEQNDPDVPVDIFGKNNNFQFRNYRGELPHHNKDDGIVPYKYTFIAENCSMDNYFTEKIIDAILGETLCFYWGCSNIETFLNPLSYVKLDLTNKEQSFKTMKMMMTNHEWESRLPYILKEKYKILEHYSLFPRVEGLIYLSELHIQVPSETLLNKLKELRLHNVSLVKQHLLSQKFEHDTLVISDPCTKIFDNFIDCLSFIVRIIRAGNVPFSHFYIPNLQNVMRASFPRPEDYFSQVSPELEIDSQLVLCRGDCSSNVEKFVLRIPSI
jgi:Glycosyltransferase family 10 (fucosyltransferase).